jgi:hypothetical protein
MYDFAVCRLSAFLSMTPPRTIIPKMLPDAFMGSTFMNTRGSLQALVCGAFMELPTRVADTMHTVEAGYISGELNG